MRILVDSIFILTVLIWLLGLAHGGYITPEQTAIFLCLLVMCRAAINIKGIGRLIRLVFLIGLPVASLLTLSIIFGEGSVQEAIRFLLALLPLLIALIGVYIMFAGVFGSKKK